MKLALALVVLFVAVAAGYRSGYDCRRICDHAYKPVCSTEGSTYDNECMLKCDWSYKACDGRCPCYQYRPRPVYHRPIVGYEYAPVSYYEPTVISYEPSVPSYDCHCSKDKDYVCTYDNETYDNECEARCDGKVKACDGPCPCGYKK